MMHAKHGSLEVIIGPVSSDKSSTLAKRLEDASRQGSGTIGFVSELSCRDKKALPQGYRDDLSFSVWVVKDALNIPLLAYETGALVVGIDNGHFLQDGLAECVDALIGQGCRVILASCETDFRGEAFDIIARLMAKSDAPIERLFAKCRVCGGRATRSQRFHVLPDGKERPSHRYEGTHTVCVEGFRCEPRCRSCHQVPDRPVEG